MQTTLKMRIVDKKIEGGNSPFRYEIFSLHTYIKPSLFLDRTESPGMSQLQDRDNIFIPHALHFLKVTAEAIHAVLQRG